MPNRQIFCEDVFSWFKKNNNLTNHSIVTSLPDISEFPNYSLEKWQEWFISTASFLMSRSIDEGVVIFYQSDIKLDGTWVDKSFLCQMASLKENLNLLWHKIVCKAPPGTSTFGTPSFSHILCFSKKIRLADLSKSTPDVLPCLGEKTWQRGMGLSTALMISRFVLEHTNTKMILNPFCGEGSVVAAANSLGLDAIGIERSPKRAKKANLLQVSSDFKNWNSNYSTT